MFIKIFYLNYGSFLKFFLFNIFTCDYSFNQHFDSSSDLMIDTCYFQRTTEFSGYGGIIFCSNIVSTMNLQNCIFHQCFCSHGGGAIYFYCDNSESGVFMRKVCANRCYSGNNQWYQFALIWVSNQAKNIIELQYLTTYLCNNNINNYCSFNLVRGNMSLLNFNSSQNINKEYSGIYIYGPTILNSRYCTYFNNSVDQYRTIMLETTQSSDIIISCNNIINNNSPQNYGVITNWGGIYTFNNCIFYNNLNILFFVQSGELTIYNCKINHLGQNIFQGVVNNNDNFFFLTSSFNLLHLNTYLCFGNLNEEIYSFKKGILKLSSNLLIFLFFILFSEY